MESDGRPEVLFEAGNPLHGLNPYSEFEQFDAI